MQSAKPPKFTGSTGIGFKTLARGTQKDRYQEKFHKINEQSQPLRNKLKLKQKEEYLRQLVAKKLDNKEIRAANILTARYFREANPNRECPLCDDGSKHAADKCPAFQNCIIGDKPKQTIDFCRYCAFNLAYLY